MQSFSLSNLSLKYRLPLLIGILLLVSVVASTVASYRGARESAREVAAERLQDLTKQLALLMQQSGATLTTQTFNVANEPAIRAFLQSPSVASQAEASTLLKQFTPVKDPNALHVELWDMQNSLRLTVPSGVSPEQADLGVEFKVSNAEPFRAVGPLRISDNIVKFPAVAAVRDEDGNPIGYLVRWRRTSLNPTPKQLMDLLGSDAVLYLGNVRGDLLTNMDTIVSSPSAAAGSVSEVRHYSREGHAVMGLGRPIAGTPWFVLVEFPEQHFRTQTNRFLRRILLIDVILFIVGMAGALALSRSITRPLNLLTGFVSQITHGDYSGKPNLRRNDEVGMLGNAFSSMIEKVSDSQIELQRKVEDLSESELRLQTVIENLSEGLVVSDMDGQLLHWNLAALDIHGFARPGEGLLKLPDFTSIFELSDMNGFKLELDQWPLSRIMRGERLRNLEISIRPLNGEWHRILNYGGSLVHEAGGRLIAIVSMSDITERKLAEQDRVLLASIVESSDDAIIGKTLDGKITSWNKGAEKLYGYKAEEVTGRSIAILFPPEQPNELAAILEGLRRGETLEHFETERITKDGKRIFVSLTISPIRESSGAIAGSSTIARNITERKHAEEAIRTSETRYRTIFESATDGILIIDADTGQILDINPYLITMLRFPKQEIVGKKLWDTGPFKDIVASKLAFSDLQERGYVRYENLPLVTREGVIRQVEFVSNSYLAGEKQVIQCNIRDITERKLAEGKLKSTNQRLEQTLVELQSKTRELKSMTQQLWQASKLATVGELAASVAHELNNPLATISLRLESLADQLILDTQKSQSVEIVVAEVERMSSLVSSLLEFSRRGQPQISTIEIAEEISKAVELIDYYLRSHRIDVVQDFEVDLPTIQADRQQLRQVFLNLLTNASDAMPDGGKLIVRAGKVRNEDGQKGLSVQFTDAGMGIEPADLVHIWDPFFTTKPEGKGTGLGLAICRRVIEEHLGQISIESQPGQGTTATIFLPATGEEGEQVDREH